MKYNDNEIIALYNKGQSPTQIASYLGTYNTTIRRILLRNGVKLMDSSTRNRIVKTNPFNVKDTYWLGWLATDGCVTNGYIVLELQERDEYILKEYISYIGYTLNILTTKHKKGSILKRVQFKCPEAVDFLSSVGIVSRKSKILEINLEFDWDFIRGVFDGDGTFHNGFIVFSASIKFVKQLEKFLTDEGFSPKVSKRGNLYQCALYKKSELKRLYGLLYENGGVFLERKHLKMVQHLRNQVTKTRLKRGNDSIAIPC